MTNVSIFSRLFSPSLICLILFCSIHGVASLSQMECKNATVTLESKLTYADYGTAMLRCNNITRTCTKVYPVEFDRNDCSSISGIFYVGDVSIDCVGISLQALNWGLCTAPNCSVRSIDVLFQDASTQSAEYYALYALQNCAGSASNIHRAAINETSNTRNATIVQPASNVSNVPSFSELMCFVDTAALDGATNYSEYYSMSFSLDGNVYTGQYPTNVFEASCLGMSGIFYTADMYFTCVPETVRYLHIGICAATGCSLSNVEAMYNETAVILASQQLVPGLPAFQDCVGTAMNVQRRAPTLPPSGSGTEAPTQTS